MIQIDGRRALFIGIEKDGGTIEFTQSAVVLEDLISKFLSSSAEKEGTKAGPDAGGAAAPAAGH